jgi:hypothetical protein
LYRPEKALGKTIELKRGIADTSESGAFTKTLVYFRGLRAIEQFVASGGDLRRLYVGKIAFFLGFGFGTFVTLRRRPQMGWNQHWRLYSIDVL